MSATRPKIFKLFEADILDSPIFTEAITHRSAGRRNNERLEFLGDSVLNLVITQQLFASHPKATEGELSRLRAHLVRGETLAELAADYDLGHALKLGAGELKSGGFRRESIMEDAFEAIFGAVYLIKGYAFTRDFILKIYTERLDDLPDPEALKDPKSRLQEWLQSRGEPIPEYALVESRGEAHNQVFTAECRIPSCSMKEEGTSRRKAEQGAALKILNILLAKNKK